LFEDLGVFRFIRFFAIQRDVWKMKTGVWKIDGHGRPSEDRSFIREVSGESLIAGVFDGHSGSFTVEFTVRKLPEKLEELVKAVGDNEAALKAGLKKIFLNHDKFLAQQGGLSYRDSGCTATVCILTPKLCCFAYLGDSPACIFNPDTGEIYASIGKHEPTVPAERARIERNGGEVSMEDDDAPRVNGCLMVSRAFGDFSLKFKDSNRPTAEELARNWATDFCVVADPDIVCIPRPEKALIAICSDGFVDTAESMVFRPYTEVVEQIRKACRNTVDLKDVAQVCINEQVSNMSDSPATYDADDITLMLISFGPVPSVKPLATQHAGTRKNKVGHRRTRSASKKKLARSFYI